MAGKERIDEGLPKDILESAQRIREKAITDGLLDDDLGVRPGENLGGPYDEADLLNPHLSLLTDPDDQEED